MLDGAASIEKTKPHIFTLGSIASRYSRSKLTAPRFHASPIYLFVCLSCCTIVRGHMTYDISIPLVIVEKRDVLSASTLPFIDLFFYRMSMCRHLII